MLVNSKELFVSAQKKEYAIPAYNINNLEWIKYILQACNEDNSPVILAVTPLSIKYFGGYKIVSNLVKDLIEQLNIRIPVVLHLDHAKDFYSCKNAIDNGFTSVMIDASYSSFDENVFVTSKVVNYAKKYNVSVEAQLGSFGDDANSYYCSNADECKEFVLSTGIDSLAPVVGNAHGLYKDEDQIDFVLLADICKAVKIPLVLHGASGLDDNKLKTAIFCGVTKVNISTDLMCAWANSVRKYLENDKDVYDPRKIIIPAMDCVKEVIHRKNKIINSKNKL